MSLHVVTPSGLHIDQLDGHYVVSKGKQIDVYKSYSAMVTGLTSGTGEKKRKKAKAAAKPRKARKARRAAAPAAPKPRKAAKRRSTLNAHGHKRGCKCMMCSPATRKKAAAGRKRAARKSAKPRTAKKAVKKGKKGGGRGGRGGGRWSGYNPSTAGRTFGADPSEYRRRPGRPPKAEVYHGSVARFNGGGRRRGNGRTHTSGMTFHLPATTPRASLDTGFASFRGSRRGAW